LQVRWMPWLNSFVRAVLRMVAHNASYDRVTSPAHNRYNRVLHQNTVRVGAGKCSRKNGLESYGGPAHHGIKHCWT